MSFVLRSGGIERSIGLIDLDAALDLDVAREAPIGAELVACGVVIARRESVFGLPMWTVEEEDVDSSRIVPRGRVVVEAT